MRQTQADRQARAQTHTHAHTLAHTHTHTSGHARACAFRTAHSLCAVVIGSVAMTCDIIAAEEWRPREASEVMASGPVIGGDRYSEFTKRSVSQVTSSFVPVLQAVCCCSL